MNPKPILTFAIDSLEPNGYFYIVPGLTFRNSAVCSPSELCFFWCWNQAAITSQYSINWVVL